MSAPGDGTAAPRARDGRQQRHGRQEPLPEELQRVDGRAGGHAAHHGAPGGCYLVELSTVLHEVTPLTRTFSLTALVT